MLLLDNAAVSQVISMADCLTSIERVCADISEGDAIGMGRQDLYTPNREDGAPFHRWAVMPGSSVASGYMCVRMMSDMVSWPVVAGQRREEKYARAPGTWCGLVFMFRIADGEPVAIIHDGVLQHYRVGAGAGLGVKLLSREDSQTIGMIGSGGMSRVYLDAFMQVRDIRKMKVYSPTEANKLAYAEEMREQHGIEVETVDSAREAVRGTDIAALCVSAVEPVFFEEWLEPGMCVVDVTRPSTKKGFSKAVDVAAWHGAQTPIVAEESASVFYARGGYLSFVAGRPDEKEIIPRVPLNPDLLALPSLADLLSGKAPGRTSDGQTTFFSNIGEVGTQFVAVSTQVYEAAREAGVGHEIPTEWFLENVRA